MNLLYIFSRIQLETKKFYLKIEEATFREKNFAQQG